jgi:hypothetical protein
MMSPLVGANVCSLYGVGCTENKVSSVHDTSARLVGKKKGDKLRNVLYTDSTRRLYTMGIRL